MLLPLVSHCPVPNRKSHGISMAELPNVNTANMVTQCCRCPWSTEDALVRPHCSKDLETKCRFVVSNWILNQTVSELRAQVWMSHGDQLSNIPPEFHIIGHTATAPYAAIAHISKPLYGIQFHPEVTHSVKGREVIKRFILNICGCESNWTMVLCSSETNRRLSKRHCMIGRICTQGDR